MWTTPRTRTISVQCRALPHMPHTWVRWLAWKKPCWSHPCTSRTCLDCTEIRRSIQSLAPSSPYPPTTTKLKNLSFISNTSVDFLIERHFSAKSCNRLSIWNLQPSSSIWCTIAHILFTCLIELSTTSLLWAVVRLCDFDEIRHPGVTSWSTEILPPVVVTGWTWAQNCPSLLVLALHHCHWKYWNLFKIKGLKILKH